MKGLTLDLKSVLTELHDGGTCIDNAWLTGRDASRSISCLHLFRACIFGLYHSIFIYMPEIQIPLAASLIFREA